MNSTAVALSSSSHDNSPSIAQLLVLSFLSFSPFLSLLGQLALSALGFSSGGVVAGSLAAGVHSVIATANGVGVVAGSGFSLAQSVGATGGMVATAAVGALVSAVGGVVGMLVASAVAFLRSLC